MGIQLISPPTATPITLVEAKEFLRVTDNLQDATIISLINEATTYVERKTRRQLCSATYALVLDSFTGTDRIASWDYYTFPGQSQMPYAVSDPIWAWGYRAGVIYLQVPPAQSVTSITYTDTYGNTETLPSDQYVCDFVSEPARISPAYGLFWPWPLLQMNSVTITWVAGYGGPADVLETLKGAIRLYVAHRWINREGGELPNGINQLCGCEDHGSYV